MSDLSDRLRALLPNVTPGEWRPCQHLKSIETDAGCRCGYRGVIYGGDGDFAICQPGHDPEPVGQDGIAPRRYPRETEIANAALIALAPQTADAYLAALDQIAALTAERDRLRAALAPFAARADAYDPPERDDHHHDWSNDRGRTTLGDLRRARAALAEPETKP